MYEKQLNLVADMNGCPNRCLHCWVGHMPNRKMEEGADRFIMFLHYPPTSILERNSAFTAMAEAYGAEQVIYAHCHGESRFHDSIEGRHHGIEYRLVSGDYLRWMPARIL